MAAVFSINGQISLVTILTLVKITSSTAMLNRHFLIYSNFPYTLGNAACYHNTVIRKFTNTGGILINEHQLT